LKQTNSTVTVGLRFEKYVWPSFVIWGFDRSIRLLRAVFFTLTSRLSSRRSSSEVPHNDSPLPTTAASKLELISSDIVRLTIPRPRHFTWSPGQHVYLTVPKMTRIFPEAHPFTIAKVDCGGSGFRSTAKDTSEKSATEERTDSDLDFFINIRLGFTKRLANLTSSNPTTMQVIIDGPYGSPPDLRVFDTCMLLAGRCLFVLYINTGNEMVAQVRHTRFRCSLISYSEQQELYFRV